MHFKVGLPKRRRKTYFLLKPLRSHFPGVPPSVELGRSAASSSSFLSAVPWLAPQHSIPMVPCLICFLQSAISIPVRAAQRRGPGTSWKSPLWPRRLQAVPRAREHRPKLAHLEQPARSRCRRCLWRRAPWSPRPETRWPARAQRIQKHSAMNQNRCAWLSSKMLIVLQRPNFPLVTMAMRSAGTLRRSCR